MNTDADAIHEGRAGWLFLSGGTNSVLGFYTEPDRFSDAAAQAWVDLLNTRRERCAALGASYVHLIAPEKLTVYPEFYVGDLPYMDQCPSIKLPRMLAKQGLDFLLVDVVDYFRQQKLDFQLYWLTDTHWTFLGCYCAYQMLCSYLGVQARPELLQGIEVRGKLTLDLGAKLPRPVVEEFVSVNFLTHARRIGSNAIVNYKETYGLENEGGLHVGSAVNFINEGPHAIQKRVVLFGDSFSEYRAHLLTGMLAETFREVYFVWSSRMDWSYITRLRPDIVITELVERFMGAPPTDDFNVETYAGQLIAPLLRSRDLQRMGEREGSG